MEELDSVPKTSSHQAYFIRPLILFLLIGGMIVVIRTFHLEQYLENARLRNLIADCGVWAPIVYLLVWMVAPFLFVPVTPILLMGGILFGPFWGEIYVLLGATTSAIVAFLVARYFGPGLCG